MKTLAQWPHMKQNPTNGLISCFEDVKMLETYISSFHTLNDLARFYLVYNEYWQRH